MRDLDIISEELRIKDIEFVEKAKENLAKQTRRGGQSLEMKKLKEEEALVDRILQWLTEGKDIRKGDWTPKEVCTFLYRAQSYYMMNKSYKARNNPSSSNGLINISGGRLEMKSNPDQADTSNTQYPHPHRLTLIHVIFRLKSSTHSCC